MMQPPQMGGGVPGPMPGQGPMGPAGKLSCPRITLVLVYQCAQPQRFTFGLSIYRWDAASDRDPSRRPCAHGQRTRYSFQAFIFFLCMIRHLKMLWLLYILYHVQLFPIRRFDFSALCCCCCFFFKHLLKLEVYHQPGFLFIFIFLTCAQNYNVRENICEQASFPSQESKRTKLPLPHKLALNIHQEVT